MHRGARSGNQRSAAGTAEGPVVRVKRDGEGTTVQLVGELDMATVPLVREVLERECERRPLRLTLELADVEFLDSSAMNLFVTTHRRLRAGGSDLVLADPSHAVAHTMQIAQLHRLLTVAYNAKPEPAAAG